LQLQEDGYEEKDVEMIQKNMLIYKSMAQIKENKETLRRKMQQA
jgi:hypothetical protein